MYVIDISSLKKEGEFGSKEWGEACAAAAIKILKAADLPADFEWAFTERYTHCLLYTSDAADDMHV